jgi:ubiquitin-conjugating enzyme E2 O
VRAFTPGDYVINGHWLGRVEEVMDNVTVLFDDGCKCKVYQAEPNRLLANSESLMDDTESPYYPGQRVRASSTGVFKNAKWLRGQWKANRTEGVVIDVEAGLSLNSLYFLASLCFCNFSSVLPGFYFVYEVEHLGLHGVELRFLD